MVTIVDHAVAVDEQEFVEAATRLFRTWWYDESRVSTLHSPGDAELQEAVLDEPLIVGEASPPVGRSLDDYLAAAAFVAVVNNADNPLFVVVGTTGFLVLTVFRKPAAAVGDVLTDIVRGWGERRRRGQQ